MTRRTLIVGLIVGLLAVGASGATQVVATHGVLGELAEIVGAEWIEVVTIIPSGFCPSHYDLSPSDYAALLNADLVLYSGIEPWVETLAASAQCGALVQLSGSWNTPPDAAEKVAAIADLLIERVPEGESTFAANRDAYVAELEVLADSLRTEAGDLAVQDIPVVCMQWQSSFVSWIGFDVAVTFGIPETLSLSDLVRLTEAGVAAGAQLVIDNLQSGVEFGGKLAREVDAVHVVLSNFPGAMPDTATLAQLFARNADALFTAIEPME